MQRNHLHFPQNKADIYALFNKYYITSEQQKVKVPMEKKKSLFPFLYENLILHFWHNGMLFKEEN